MPIMVSSYANANTSNPCFSNYFSRLVQIIINNVYDSTPSYMTPFHTLTLLLITLNAVYLYRLSMV